MSTGTTVRNGVQQCSTELYTTTGVIVLNYKMFDGNSETEQ